GRRAGEVGDRLVLETHESGGVDHAGDEREHAAAQPSPARQLAQQRHGARQPLIGRTDITGASPITSTPLGGTKLKVSGGIATLRFQSEKRMSVVAPSWSRKLMRARPSALKPRSAWSNCGSCARDTRRSHNKPSCAPCSVTLKSWWICLTLVS